MDHFFGEEWLEVTQQNQSAFVPYYSKPSCQTRINNNSANVHKRMLQFIRKSFTEFQESGSRCHRRKMSERLRRENERTGYLALHSMLPLGTKKEKKSIIQMAARRIEELKGYKEELEMRNRDLEVKMGISGRIEVRVEKIKSGIDYVVEILKCLNGLGVEISSIQSTFSDDHCQLLAVIDVQTQIPLDEVRKEVQRTLQMETSSQLPIVQVATT